MPVIHIDLMNPQEKEDEYKQKTQRSLQTLHDFLKKDKDVFALIHMSSCGPCKATKPKWLALESKYKEDPNVCVVDIEHTLLPHVKHEPFKHGVSGFPTMRHIKGDTVQNYEDVDGIKKDRSLESFIKWLEMKGRTKTHSKKGHTLSMMGGYKFTGGKYPIHGGKWSKKYKDSIDCSIPRGFSQRQHCKYGRKKRGGNFSVKLSFDVKTGKTRKTKTKTRTKTRKNKK